MKIIGADPGRSGGVACLHFDELQDGTVSSSVLHVESYGMTGDIRRDAETLSIWNRKGCQEQILVYLEKVHAWPEMESDRAFKFGRRYGHMECVLECCKCYQVALVTPITWQSALGLVERGSGRESGTMSDDKKKRLKLQAEQLYPGHRVSMLTADALLIAEYGRRQVFGGSARCLFTS